MSKRGGCIFQNGTPPTRSGRRLTVKCVIDRTKTLGYINYQREDIGKEGEGTAEPPVMTGEEKKKTGLGEKEAVQQQMR